MNRIIWKKTVAFVLMFLMLLSTVQFTPFTPMASIDALAASPSDFADFPTGWSKEAVTAAVNNGLLNGRSASTIEPEGNLTRAEMATIINRAFGATKEANISQYTDVSQNEWYYHEIAKAVNMQTFQGDGGGTMRPDAFITREEVFAVIARALVLESTDYSSLNKFKDQSSVSDWAKPYASILVAKGYVNGDDLGNINPLSNITREEFAQIMHNIVKTYYVTTGEHKTTGADSSLIRTGGVTLSDVTIEGDLILGDGVGAGNVNLVNVTIKGRLLARGGEGKVTLTNTTVGEGVVVKDVNGVVNFNNYRTEAPFAGIREITKATFLDDKKPDTPKPPSGGGGGGGGGGGSTNQIRYAIEHYVEDSNGTVELNGIKYKLQDQQTGQGQSGQRVMVNTATFVGYTFDPTLGDGNKAGQQITLDREIKVKLYYKANTYTVTVKLPDGTQQTITYKHNETFGSKFNLSAYPDVKFYYMSTDGQTEVEVTSSLPVTSAMTILTKGSHTVTFNHNDGQGTVTEVKVYNGEKIGDKLITPPARNGYTFAGWNTAVDGTGSPVTTESLISEPKTVYAQWTAIKYTISYVSQFEFSSLAVVTREYDIETAVALPTEADFVDHTGFVFDGWYKEQNYATKINSIEVGSTGNITLYARWIDTSVTYYDVIFNLNYVGAPAASRVPVEEGLTASKPADPVRTGYNFGGWYTDSACTTAYNFATSVTAEINLYAKWTVQEYTIDYDLNGGSFKQGAYKPVKYTVEDLPLTLPGENDVAYIGKTFRGWYKDSQLTQPVSLIPANTTGAFKVYAKWETNTYTVTIVTPGEQDQEKTYTHGQKIKDLIPSEPTRPGYTFDGYNTLANGTGTPYTQESVITGPETLYTQWTPISYAINYELNQGSKLNQYLDKFIESYTIEQTVTLPLDSHVVRQGYAFGGWYTASDFSGEAVTTIPVGSKGDITLYAKWNPIPYTVTYVMNGGTEKNPAAFVKNRDVLTNAITLPVASDFAPREGYTFAGWYQSADFSGSKVFTISKGVVGNLTYYAKWDKISYSITYNRNGGIFKSSATIKNTYTVTDTVTLPVASDFEENTGKTFKGWYANSTFTGTPLTSIPFGSTGNKTYWAKWEDNKYDVKFVVDGQETIKNFTHGDKISTQVSDPSKNGYTFDGWYVNEAGTGTKYTKDSQITSALTLYPKFTAIKYTINYELGTGYSFKDGYTAPSEFYITSDDIILPTESDIKEDTNKVFKGWYLDTNYTQSITKVEKGTYKNITVYAKWVDKTKVYYDVTFAYNYTGAPQSGVYSKISVEENNLIGNQKPADPTRNGYTFKGWYSDANCTTSYDFNKKIITDVTIYAKWEINNYTIKYNLDGAEKQNAAAFVESYNVESAVTLPADSDFKQRPGYEFKGWYDNAQYANAPVTSIPVGSTGNKEYWAKWEKLSYTITYNHNGGTIKDSSAFVVSYTVTDSIILPTASDYEEIMGKTFAGWYEDATFTGNKIISIPVGTTGNKEYWAKWEDNKYTVKFVIDGVETSIEYVHGDKISTQMSDPSKNGYTFDGWNDKSDGTGVKYTKDAEITSALTLYPQFTAIKYTITYELGDGYSFKDGYTAPSEFYVTSDDITLPAESDIKEDANKVFKGWYLDTNYTQSITKVEKGTYKNITVYAKWEDKAKVYYDVVFNYNYTGAPNDGKYTTISVEENTLIGAQKPADPAREGFTFKGWYADENCTVEFDFGANIKSAITIYAKWEEIPAVKYTITYNIADGEKLNESAFVSEYSGDTEIILPVASDFKERTDGKAFAGWYDNENFEGVPVISIPVGSTGNKVFWAKWDQSYIVRFYRGAKVVGETHRKYIGDALVAAGTSMAQNDIDNMISGVNKQQTVEYYDGSYSHTVDGELWYVDNSGEWNVFNSDVKVNSNMDVFYANKFVSLCLSVELGEFTLDIPGYISVPYRTDTRLIETAKDLMAASRSKISMALTTDDIYAKSIEKAAEKTSEKDLELIDAEGNIKYVNIDTAISNIIKPEEIDGEIAKYIETIIVENSDDAKIESAILMVYDSELIKDTVLGGVPFDYQTVKAYISALTESERKDFAEDVHDVLASEQYYHDFIDAFKKGHDHFVVSHENIDFVMAVATAVNEYTYEELKDKIYAKFGKVIDVLGDDIAKEFMRDAQTRYYAGAQVLWNEMKNNTDNDDYKSSYPSYLTFRVNAIEHVFRPMFDKYRIKVIDKLNEKNFYHYSENTYLRELVEMDADTIINDLFYKVPVTDENIGYALWPAENGESGFMHYYDYIFHKLLIADNARLWYLNNLSEAELEQLRNSVYENASKALNKANEMLAAYEEDGSLPMGKNISDLKEIEAFNKLFSKVEGKLVKALEKFKTTKFYGKEWTADSLRYDVPYADLAGHVILGTDDPIFNVDSLLDDNNVVKALNKAGFKEFEDTFDDDIGSTVTVQAIERLLKNNRVEIRRYYE